MVADEDIEWCVRGASDGEANGDIGKLSASSGRDKG